MRTCTYWTSISAVILTLTLVASPSSGKDDKLHPGFFNSPRLGVSIPVPTYRIQPTDDSCRVFSYSLKTPQATDVSYSITTFPRQPIGGPQIESSLNQDGFRVLSLTQGEGKSFSYFLVEAEGMRNGQWTRGQSMYVPGLVVNLLITCTSPRDRYEQYAQGFQAFMKSIKLGEPPLAPPPETTRYRDDRIQLQADLPHLEPSKAKQQWLELSFEAAATDHSVTVIKIEDSDLSVAQFVDAKAAELKKLEYSPAAMTGKGDDQGLSAKHPQQGIGVLVRCQRHAKYLIQSTGIWFEDGTEDQTKPAVSHTIENTRLLPRIPR